MPGLGYIRRKNSDGTVTRLYLKPLKPAVAAKPPSDICIDKRSQLSMSWAPKFVADLEDTEFIIRLTRINSGSPVSVDFYYDTYSRLLIFKDKVMSAFLGEEKALVLQTSEAQFYLMRLTAEEGFCLHIENKKRERIALTFKEFQKVMSFDEMLTSAFQKFDDDKKAKLKKNLNVIE